MTLFIIWSFYFIFQFITSKGVQMNQNNLPVLAYHYDTERKVYWYCEFGTKEIVSNSKEDFKLECENLYKVYRYISQDGQEHFPFLRYHSTLGIRLKCAVLNILNGKLLGCESDKEQDLHTTCKYTCNDGFTARSPNVTCDLIGQPHNVSAAWSISHDYCIGKSSLDATDSVSSTTTVMENITFLATDPVSSTNTMMKNIIPLVTPLQPNNEAFQKMHVVLILVIVGFLLICAVVVSLFVLNLRKKKHSGSSTSLPSEVGFGELTWSFYSTPLLKDSDKKLKNENSNKDQSYKEHLDDKDLENHLFTTDADTSLSTSIEIEDISKGIAELPFCSMSLLKESDKLLKNEENFNKDHSHKEQLDKTLENLLATSDDTTSLTSDFKINVDDCSVHSPEKGPTEQCTTSVALFNQQTLTYRRELRGELEVIEGRHRCEALVGYITENLKRLGYSSENEIKVEEATYKDRTDEKVTDFFLFHMASHGDTIGMMLEYFHRMKAQNVVDVVLKVHNDCTFCKQFKPDTYKW